MFTASGIHYTSIRPVAPRNPADGKDAKIKVAYYVDSNGVLTGYVYNNTDDILILDQTKSFFVNSDGTSLSYYDPTVHTTSSTDLSSGTRGASVNLGAVGGALGIGGALGSILNGVNVGGSSTNGNMTTNTTYKADMPLINIGPKGNVELSKKYVVKNLAGLSNNARWDDIYIKNFEDNPSSSPIKYGITLTYSTDGGKTFERISTDFYVNSIVSIPIVEQGKINDAMRKLYTIKPDAPCETWYNGKFVTVKPDYADEFSVTGFYWDYK